MKFQSPFDTENILTPDATNEPWEIKRAIEVVESYNLPDEAMVMAALGLGGRP